MRAVPDLPVTLALIVVVLGIARWRFKARLPAAAVGVIDFVLNLATLIIAALGLTAIVLFLAIELFHYRPPQFTIVPIYLVMGVLVWSAIRSVQRRVRVRAKITS